MAPKIVRPRIVRVYSENNDFQYIDTLRRNREKRHKQGVFFVEGVRPINHALKYGWTVEAFAHARGRRLSDWATDILAQSRARTHYELPASLLDKLSNKTDPSELIALVAIPPDDLSRIAVTEDLCVVVVDRPASPGNLGTLIRSCDALRVDGLVIAGHAADLYDPATVAASTGSFFALPTVRVGGPADVLSWVAELRHALGRVQIVGSSAKATMDIACCDLTGPTILVVGNETWGMSRAFKEMCDVVATIPIAGSATSLNLACAATVLLYERDRQRRAHGAAPRHD